MGWGHFKYKILKESITGVGGFRAKKDVWSGRIFSGIILKIVIFKIIFKITNGMAKLVQTISHIQYGSTTRDTISFLILIQKLMSFINTRKKLYKGKKITMSTNN